jgi:predicted nucleic acid-binding protein
LAYERLNINKETQDRIINTFQRFGIQIEPPVSTMPMTDETDRIFYDTARASGATLITGNIKHYPAEPFIMTPSHFLENLDI